MKIMIAGAMGYVGSALIEIYRNTPEVEILAIDKEFNPRAVAQLPDNVRFIHANCEDLDLMRFLLKDIDVVHFLVAEVEAEKSIDKEEAVWKTNYELPKSIIEMLPKSTRFMFPSTGNVFGGVSPDGKFLGLTEEDTPAPKYAYAETKVAVEKLLHESKVDYTIVRFGTNHGYSPGIRFNLVTNIFFKRAMEGQALTIHGAGDNYRPTACVKDCARALDFLSKNSDVSGEIFHVVCETFQIRELAENVIKYVGNPASKTDFIAKDVPFNAYGLNSDKIKRLGFEFLWPLEKSLTEMKEIFKQLSSQSAEELS